MVVKKTTKPRVTAFKAETTRVLEAEEDTEGFVTATVAFPDGLNQSVRLPAWATKENLKAEAVRIRKESETKTANKTERGDLKD